MSYAVKEIFYTLDGTACGRCEACLLRLRGFREAGVEDPIRYEKREG